MKSAVFKACTVIGKTPQDLLGLYGERAERRDKDEKIGVK